MPRNGSGVYTLPAGNPVVPGTTIDAAWANSTLNDIANELTNSLSRTGAGGMIAPFRIADGNITAPGLSFLNETGSGLYRSGAGSVWMSILGTNTMQFATTAVTVASSRTLNALGNALVGGTLGVTGATTLASTLAVTGALTATGGVLGNITAASGTSTFHDVLINGSLDMAVGSSATITGLSTPTNASDAATKGYVDTQDALRLALTGGTMSGAIAMGANKITGLGTPSADTDAANKAYVDSVAQGLDIKASVRAATTTNISLSGAQTIDGVAVIAGDRVLVKNQSSAADNGIYVASASTWARASDANTWDKLVGAFTFVEDGSTNDNSGWVCAISPGGTLGVTAVTWEQFSGAGQITAGAGLTKTGNTLNVGTASSARIVVGADEIDLAQTGVSAGTYKSVTVDLFGRVTAGTNPTTLAGYGITDAYTNTQTDTLLNGKLSLTGGTMTGALAMGTNRITGMGDPVNAQDAATKNYIDTIFGSTSSAAASAAAAASSASAASTSASNASTSASNASSSASAAAASAASAAASYDSFDDRYLGAKSSDPTVDNDGNALITGALYWNTVGNIMKTWTGTAWVSSINPISMPDGTANGVAYLNGSKVLTTGSALTFNGTTLQAPQFYQIQSLAGAYNSQVLENTSSTGYTQFLFNVGSGGANGQAVIGYAPGLFFSLGPTSNDTTTPIVFRVNNGSEQMRLTSTGLGIGTSSPSSRLTVTSSGTALAQFTGAQYSQIRHSDGTRTLYTQVYDNLAAIGTESNTPLSFITNNSGKMLLDSSGNLGIGTSSPAGRLDVVGTADQIRAGNGTVTSFLGGSGSNGYTGTLTNHAFLFYTNSAERMRLDTSGNLLVGGTTSYGRLTTYGNLVSVGDGPDAGVSLRSTSGRDSYGLFNINESGTASALGFYWIDGSGNPSTGTERLRLDSSGNLGLGVTPSAWGSSYKAFEMASAGLMSNTNGGSFFLINNAYYNGTNWIYKYSQLASRYDQSSGIHAWFTAPSGTAGNAISFTQAMTLDSNGRLAIGDTNAFGFRLHTNAGASVSGHLVSGTTTGVYTNWSDGSATDSPQIGGIGNNLVLRTLGTERARITSDGNLLVGTTSSGLGEPRASIYAGGAGSRHALSIKGSTDSGYDVQLVWHPATSGTRRLMEFGVGTVYTTVGNIASDGSTTSYNTTSDYRLKENIQPMTGALAKVAALKPVTYTWKADGSDGEGFIAHELAEVCPQAVTGEKDAVDADGNPQYQGIDTSFLVATLAAAIKELKAEFDAYKATHP